MQPVNSHQQKIVVISIICMIVSGFAYAYFFLLEWKEKEINLGYTKEAHRNSMLAAQMFLEKNDVDSEIVISFSLLDNIYPVDQSKVHAFLSKPGPQDNIILTNARGTVNGSRFKNIWQWVQSGGTLITTISNPYSDSLQGEDELFRALEVVTEKNESLLDISLESMVGELGKITDDDQYFKEDLIVDDMSQGDHDQLKNEVKTGSEREGFVYSDALACNNTKFTKIALPLQNDALKVDFGFGDFLNYGNYVPEWLATSEVGGEQRIVAAGFNVEAGKIFVLRNTRIWHNHLIQCHDHAYFLWSLINKNEKVWFLENRDSPSLFSLVLRYLPYGFAGLCATLVLAVWSALSRFGPLFNPQPVSRRSFAEHIEANARFLWRQSHYPLLIDGLRNTIESAMATRVTGYEKKPDKEKLRYVTKFTPVEEDLVRLALFKTDIETSGEFIQFVKILKEIKGHL